VGDADIAFRPQERERLETTFPDHKTVIVEGAGLYTESDAPEEFVAAIRDWWFAPGGWRAPSARGDVRRKTLRES
jgi:haloalkane dehalogenase